MLKIYAIFTFIFGFFGQAMAANLYKSSDGYWFYQRAREERLAREEQLERQKTFPGLNETIEALVKLEELQKEVSKTGIPNDAQYSSALLSYENASKIFARGVVETAGSAWIKAGPKSTEFERCLAKFSEEECSQNAGLFGSYSSTIRVLKEFAPVWQRVKGHMASELELKTKLNERLISSHPAQAILEALRHLLDKSKQLNDWVPTPTRPMAQFPPVRRQLVKCQQLTTVIKEGYLVETSFNEGNALGRALRWLNSLEAGEKFYVRVGHEYVLNTVCEYPLFQDLSNRVAEYMRYHHELGTNNIRPGYGIKREMEQDLATLSKAASKIGFSKFMETNNDRRETWFDKCTIFYSFHNCVLQSAIMVVDDPKSGLDAFTQLEADFQRWLKNLK